MEDLIQNVALFLGGGGFAALLNYWTNKNKGRSDDFKLITESYREEFDRLRDKINETEKLALHWEEKHNELSKKYVELEALIRRIVESNPNIEMPDIKD